MIRRLPLSAIIVQALVERLEGVDLDAPLVARFRLRFVLPDDLLVAVDLGDARRPVASRTLPPGSIHTSWPSQRLAYSHSTLPLASTMATLPRSLPSTR